jgi:hypothetical protein
VTRRPHILAGVSSYSSRAIAARVAILVSGVLAALAFWQVSGTINYQPRAAPFPGWLAVLQPASTGSAGSQVQLQVQPVESGAPGSHPALSYSVVACGALPFSGVLLIGGDARLRSVRMLAPAHTSLSSIANAEVLDVGTGQAVRLGTVQALRFTLTRSPCFQHFSPEGAASGISGNAVEVTGRAGHSVVQPGRFGLWDGPRSTQSWPLVGSLPGIAATDLGEWKVAGLTGSWTRPFREYIRLDAGSLTTVGSLEAARPTLADVSRLSWASTSPVEASARVLNTTTLGRWQDRLVAVTIALTLAGSLLAAALFDLVPPLRPATRAPAAISRPGSTNTQMVPDSNAGADKSSLTDHRRRSIAVVITLAAFYAWVLARRPKRHLGNPTDS